MSTVKIHLQGKRSIKVAMKNLGEHLYIAGYECNECKGCHLYSSGDEIVEERWCDKLVTIPPRLELKVEYSEEEVIKIV